MVPYSVLYHKAGCQEKNYASAMHSLSVLNLTCGYFLHSVNDFTHDHYTLCNCVNFFTVSQEFPTIQYHYYQLDNGLPCSGKFSWGPIFVDGQSSMFSRTHAIMPITHCIIVLISRIVAHPQNWTPRKRVPLYGIALDIIL
jgi:hypothetical protein